MININNRDSRPVYAQIMDQFRLTIVTGAMKPEEKLPSVRELSQELAINPNTIQRAYRELEQEGYIYSVAGKGSFVAEFREVDSHRRDELLTKFDDIVRELSYLGIDAQQLYRRMGEEEKR